MTAVDFAIILRFVPSLETGAEFGCWAIQAAPSQQHDWEETGSFWARGKFLHSGRAGCCNGAEIHQKGRRRRMGSCCLYQDEGSCDWCRLHLEVGGKDESDQYRNHNLLQLGQHFTYRLLPFFDNSYWPDQQHKISKTSYEGFCTVEIAQNCVNFKCQVSMN